MTPKLSKLPIKLAIVSPMLTNPKVIKTITGNLSVGILRFLMFLEVLYKILVLDAKAHLIKRTVEGCQNSEGGKC
jgi:hypothetical protein